MKKIGILLPRSTYYSSINFELFQGLKSGLQSIAKEKDFQVVSENIGFGAEKQQSYRSAERLVLEEDADIVFAYIGQRTAQLLRPLFMSAKKLLIVLDAGSSLPHEWPVSPNIFYLSLNNAAGTYLASKLALRDGFREAGMVTGYYDGGYLHTMSLVQSFMDGGGTMCFNHATGYKEEDFSMKPLTAMVEKYPHSALLSIFSGDFMAWYCRELKENFPGAELPLYLCPFALEEKVLEEAPWLGTKATGVAAWARSLQNPENKKFMEAMNAAGRDATIFSLLGWEAARMASEIFEIHSRTGNWNETYKNIAGITFDSPRGKIAFDEKLQTSYCNMYEVKLNKSDKGGNSLSVLNEIGEVRNALNTIASYDLGNFTSGWYNSYACN